MPRGLTRAACALALVGCAPGRLHLEPVVFAPTDGTASAPTVFVGFPVDARPPAERIGGSLVYTTPVPTLYYGDVNLRPGALDAVDRTLLDALEAAGVSLVDHPEEAELVVQPYVLYHRGVRDVSDAHWVNLATAGTAGTVAQFLYPAVIGAAGHLRLEIRAPDGSLVTVRDVRFEAVRRRSLGRLRSLWYGYTRSPTKELFAEAFAELHGELGAEVAQVVLDAHAGPIEAGVEPEIPALHTLHDRWERPKLAGRHVSPHFSPVTGHLTERGEAIGKLGFPFDTVGYEVGLHDRAQGLVNITLLGLPRFEEGAETVGIGTFDTIDAYLQGDLEGLFNSVSGGLRGQLVRSGDWALSLEGRTGAQFVLRVDDDFVPRVASITARGSVIASWHAGAATWFARAGASHAAPVELFAEEPLVPGTRATAGLGAELQLTGSLAAAMELIGDARVDEPTPPTVYPQLTLGLR